MLKGYFVSQGIKEVQLEAFIRKNFPLGDYSRTEINRTPMGIRVTIYTNKPGRIIGKGGQNINNITEALRTKFGLQNPQVDVKSIANPDLDSKIMAKQIAYAIERGLNVKKIGNLAVTRIMSSGATGVEIVIAGKLTGSKAMTAKFIEGYIVHSGDPLKTMVDYGFEEALTKPGKIGIKVKIMKDFMDITGEIRKSKNMTKKEEDTLRESLEREEAAKAAETLAAAETAEIEKTELAKVAGKKKEGKSKARKPAAKKAPAKARAKEQAAKNENVEEKGVQK